MSSGRDTRGDPLKKMSARMHLRGHPPLLPLARRASPEPHRHAGRGSLRHRESHQRLRRIRRRLLRQDRARLRGRGQGPPSAGVLRRKAINDFVGEARKALQLEGCPNTVGVLVCGVKPFPFIVMTFVSGGALSERVRQLREEIQSGDGNAVRQRARKIPIDFAYRVLVDIASALKVAHEKGIVHRDLKPGNALIRRDSEGRETVLVSDWGIAIARREGRKVGALRGGRDPRPHAHPAPTRPALAGHAPSRHDQPGAARVLQGQHRRALQAHGGHLPVRDPRVRGRHRGVPLLLAGRHPHPGGELGVLAPAALPGGRRRAGPPEAVPDRPRDALEPRLHPAKTAGEGGHALPR